MARYIGPKRKIERRFGSPIFSGKQIDRKKYPPGQHGNSLRRKKKSEYANQLFEKQNAKYIYGILERQFLRLFNIASRKKGITGEILLQLCELRLDNIIFRLQIANSRAAARQLVTHRHITVNKKIVNIPSYITKIGDVISIKDKSIKNHKTIKESLESIKNNNNINNWLVWNHDNITGTIQEIPNRDQIPENIKEQLIVELYSK